MAGKPSRPWTGEVFFWVERGHVVARSDCPRGQPPRDAKLWAVEGQPGRGWLGMESYGTNEQARSRAEDLAGQGVSRPVRHGVTDDSKPG